MLPILILHHLCAFLFTVCGTLIDPTMHKSVELTCFADEVIVRLAQVSQLHGIGQLAVEVELRRHSAWQNSICAVVNEHLTSPLENPVWSDGSGAHSPGKLIAGQ